eukprot:969221_1
MAFNTIKSFSTGTYGWVDITSSVIIDNFTLVQQKTHEFYESQHTLNEQQQSLLLLLSDGYALEEALNAIFFSMFEPDVIDQDVQHQKADSILSNQLYCDRHITYVRDDEISNNKCYLTDCDHLVQFVKTMKQYHRTHYQYNHKKHSSINDTLDHYLHLIEYHCDHHFDLIVKCLGHCNLNKCNKFKQNYRNRQELSQKHNDINISLRKTKRVCKSWIKCIVISVTPMTWDTN